MIDIDDFRDCVVRPALAHLDLYSLAAEQLVLATAVHESGLRHLRQIGSGPALGFFQMEPQTHHDIWANFLRHRLRISGRVKSLRASAPEPVDQLATNHAYACAMCRIQYYRRPEPLPPPNAAEAIGRYWKRFYNSGAGAGTVPGFILSFNEHVKPLYR